MLALRRATGEGARLIIKCLGARRPLEAAVGKLGNDTQKIVPANKLDYNINMN